MCHDAADDDYSLEYEYYTIINGIILSCRILNIISIIIGIISYRNMK